MEPKRKLVEPFHFLGNSVGCLLIHGFTGSPSEMRFLGERLCKAGYTVLGIRLSGHGSTPEDMAKTRWENWVDDAQAGVRQLRKRCQTVVGIGFSMGGLIALHLATEGLLDGLITMNAPMVLQDRKTRFAGLFKIFREYAEKSPAHQLASNASMPGQERFYYEKVPLACLDSLNRAIRRTRHSLGEIDCPTMLMQSTKDQTVSPSSVKIIEQCLKKTKPLVIHYEKSGHILPLGPERVEVAEQIIGFIKKIEGKG